MAEPRTLRQWMTLAHEAKERGERYLLATYEEISYYIFLLGSHDSAGQPMCMGLPILTSAPKRPSSFTEYAQACRFRRTHEPV